MALTPSTKRRRAASVNESSGIKTAHKTWTQPCPSVGLQARRYESGIGPRFMRSVGRGRILGHNRHSGIYARGVKFRKRRIEGRLTTEASNVSSFSHISQSQESTSGTFERAPQDPKCKGLDRYLMLTNDSNTCMHPKITFFALEHFARPSRLETSLTTNLRCHGLGLRRWSRSRACGLKLFLDLIDGLDVSFTLIFFDAGVARGVPSLFSPVLALKDGTDSSRRGRTFRSAYFLQLLPQVSQRRLEGSPFGAFHQTLDSRVLHAPQLGGLDGCATTEESSSEGPTICFLSNGRVCLLPVLVVVGVSFICLFSSPSFELEMPMNMPCPIVFSHTFSNGRRIEQLLEAIGLLPRLSLPAIRHHEP
jgi:hypothetical protein